MSFLAWLFGKRSAADDPARGDPARVAQVEEVLAELRPLFRADAGDMRLVAVEDDGWVVLRTLGSCHGCQVSALTLQGALAPRLRARCAWFAGVRTAD
jgi:Fe-S cluster biogenesis protein NfuA